MDASRSGNVLIARPETAGVIVMPLSGPDGGPVRFEIGTPGSGPPGAAPASPRHKRFLIACGLVWILVASSGFVVLWNYAASPGRAGTPPGHWPAGARIRPDPSRFALVLAVHPHCPCSRATIGELAVIMTQCHDRVRAHVLVVKPASFSRDWEKTDLWESVSEIPGVSVLCDVGGVEAMRFGAATSGQALLYHPGGALLFSGGITGARGHSGDNPGRIAIVSLITSGVGDRSDSAVFGCALSEQSDPPPKEGSQ